MKTLDSLCRSAPPILTPPDASTPCAASRLPSPAAGHALSALPRRRRPHRYVQSLCKEQMLLCKLFIHLKGSFRTEGRASSFGISGCIAASRVWHRFILSASISFPSLTVALKFASENQKAMAPIVKIFFYNFLSGLNFD